MSEISQMGDDDVFVKVSGTVSVSGVSAQPGDDEQGGKTVPDNKLQKVRPKYSSLKKCVRSKLNRCLTHRCQFEEVEQERRILVRGDDGRMCQKTEVERIWRCEVGSSSGKTLASGGKFGGRTKVQSGSQPGRQEVCLSTAPKHRR